MSWLQPPTGARELRSTRYNQTAGSILPRPTPEGIRYPSTGGRHGPALGCDRGKEGSFLHLRVRMSCWRISREYRTINLIFPLLQWCQKHGHRRAKHSAQGAAKQGQYEREWSSAVHQEDGSPEAVLGRRVELILEYSSPHRPFLRFNPQISS